VCEWEREHHKKREITTKGTSQEKGDYNRENTTRKERTPQEKGDNNR